MAMHKCGKCPKSFPKPHGLEIHRRRAHGPNAVNKKPAKPKARSKKKSKPKRKAKPRRSTRRSAGAQSAPQRKGNGLANQVVRKLRAKAVALRAEAQEIDRKIAGFVTDTKRFLS